ncbi:MAG: hypothetical protein WB610_16845 [Rhodomicrobium sp.]|jgi:hypothetical protein
MTPQKASSHAQRNSSHVLDLLRVFLDKHHLSLEELAGLLRISPLTLEEWFHEGVAPPAACLALAVLFDAGKLMSGRKRQEQWPTPPHRGGRQNDYMLRMVRAI